MVDLHDNIRKSGKLCLKIILTRTRYYPDASKLLYLVGILHKPLPNVPEQLHQSEGLDGQPLENIHQTGSSMPQTICG
jgi:hypothetical protein